MQRLRDFEPVRALALAAVCLVTAINIAAFIFFGNGGENFFPKQIRLSEAAMALLMFTILYILAPAFIGLRIVTAPKGSAIFPIAFLTCAAAGFFLYVYFFVCGPTGQCNLFKFLNIPVFWAGAFFCLFPSGNEP